MVPVMLPIIYFLAGVKYLWVLSFHNSIVIKHERTDLKQQHLLTSKATLREFESLYLLRMFLRRGTYCGDQLSK